MGEYPKAESKKRSLTQKKKAAEKKAAEENTEFFDTVAPKKEVEAPTSNDDIQALFEEEPEEQKVLWEPLSDVHKEFLSSEEDEVLMAGGRGSGKSEVLLVDPLRFCNHAKFRGLILRRTMDELREIISRAQELYPAVFPGTKWKEQQKMFQFPSGAKMEFGYCDRIPQDLERYKGQEYQWLGLDELTQWASEEVIERMSASLRTTDKSIPVFIRACVDEGNVLTANRGWVPIQDVTPSDEVYSLTENDELRINPVTSVSSYDVDEPLVRVRKKNLYMSMTQDHRVLYKKSGAATNSVDRWNEITSKTVDIVRHPIISNEGSSYTETLFRDTDPTDWVCFLGLYLAEGSIRQRVINDNYSVCITQQKAHTRPLIRQLLSRIGGLKWHEQNNGDFVAHCKELRDLLLPYGKAKDKYIPRNILAQASREQLELLLFWLFLGDGHWSSPTSGTYTTTSEQLARDVSELGVRLGYKVKFTKTELDNPSHNDRYDVYLTRAKTNTTRIEKNRGDVSLEPYKGKVYCITVANNDNFIIEQQGSVWVSSNTTNPDGPGRMWVKDRFIDAAPSGKTAVFAYDTPKGKIHLTRKWIHSTVFDNPVLMDAQPQYVAKLMALKGRGREVWLDGSWDAADGMAFDEFDRRIHVVKPFVIPPGWPRFAALDWGFGDQSLAVCLWFAIDPEGHYYIYRELVANGPVPIEKKLTAPKFALKLNELERADNDRVEYTVVDGQMDQNHGSGGPTLYEQMKVSRRRFKFANKAKGSRASGKQLIHELLAVDPVLKKPKLQIFENCTQIVRELSSLPLNPNDSEDVDTKAEDHAYDALRYGLTSRPNTSLRWDKTRPTRRQSRPIFYC